MAAALLLLLSIPLLAATSSSSAAGDAMPAAEHRALTDILTSLLADQSWAELHPLPCSETPWPGVQCDTVNTDFLHVVSIHIGPDVISSPPCKSSAFLPPAALLHLPFLKSLSLFSCFLTPNSASLPPSIFTDLSSLQHLVLNSNPGLSGEIPSSVSTLQSLTVLSLSQNGFRGGIPPEIGRLTGLRQLDLSYNHLAGDIPEEISGLSSLAILDLSSNELEGNLPSSIGILQSLQKIDISFNSLAGRVPPAFGELKRLVLLDLSHNNLTGPFAGKPLRLEGIGLTVIGLSRCELFGPIPSSFGSLISLTALSLDRNRLNGSVPASLGSLPELGQLNLSQNQLAGEILFSVEFVKRLGKRLDLRGNRDLCARENKYEEGSFRLEAPACLCSSSAGNGGNRAERGEEEDGDVRISPALDGGDQTGNCHFGPVNARHMCFLGFAILVALLA
ncbi:hypothetical protein KSP39_PZI009102 [Platanthera zijinensis]|uniref:Piriformospora indica-insensitive protein 2 n=1 Tax=Platanthera zijinensis TaxID=2320716 RepID=A0AAP0G7X7_9ASPA